MDEKSSQSPGGSYFWVIPLITTVVVTAAVVMGLLLYNARVPIDTIPEPPDSLPPGSEIYQTHCATCHGEDGLGAARRYPPLVDTDWVLDDEQRLILITLHGLIGPIEVNERQYDDYMPPLGHRLSDPEIALVLSYIRTSWGNDAEAISTDTVRNVRQAYPHPRDPWTAEELQSRPHTP